MDRGWNSDFVFNVDCVKHWCGICWLLFAASFVWSDWPLGLLWKASWHYVSTVILRHSWLYWHGSMVLTQKNGDLYPSHPKLQGQIYFGGFFVTK